jgi:protein-S-isoprenylcysteine O-methyltransferase Ste14
VAVDAVLLRKIIVTGSALIYWAGVSVQIHRVRQRIGRSPNVGPRGLKEKLLWLGWLLVVTAWAGQPFLVGRFDNPLFFFIPFLVHPIGLLLGMLIMLGGYAGTVWCYAALGDAWRMGIRRHEQTTLVKDGPYRYVRHPIYLFQIVMLVAVFFLLPTPFSILILALHLACVLIKSRDEELHLLRIHGSLYRAYISETGSILPKWKKSSGRC